MTDDTYRPDPRRWKALTVCLAAGFMTLLDVSIVNVALPSVKEALDASDAVLQWVVSGYALTIGLVLVAAGRVGDALGRRTVFIAGVVVFAVGSLLAGTAQDGTWLVVARLVQGVGSGIVGPQVSGLIQQLFRGPERGIAFGRFGTTVGISTAVGPLLGGLILAVAGPEHGWRWVFLVNLPVAVLAVVLALRYLDPPARRERVADLDLVGALLLGLGVVGVLWPTVSRSWGALSLVVAGAGVVALAGFVGWEQRVTARGDVPMVQPSLFRRPGFSAGALLGLLYFSGFTAIFFVLALFFQDGAGYTPLQAGVAITPFALGSAVSSVAGGRWVGRGGRRVVVAGLVVVLVGVAATDVVVGLRSAGADVGLWTALPLLVAGVGSGLVIAPNQTVTLSRVPVPQAGAAGGVLQTGQRLGAATGIAVVGSLYFAGVADGDGAAGVAHGLRATLALLGLSLAVGVLDLVRTSRSTPAGEPV
ncbi:MFS transporter [Cellulomonas sp. KH9]|uniref:MFS transporter n=1 Tax=Cellulomonas sp. KH9 TaxID=1855324 RepID=UPI0008EC7A2E|nr:MFS transporter [Cellulomonas sp. KH9]SFK34054.1 drug resistance transporter, EmrB/QacA subfamily [Cellulomonas sp. KH9]